MMRAFRNSYPVDGKLHRAEVPIPTPEGTQVLLKVLAAGVCHSDITLLDPKLSSNKTGAIYTVGHEICGRIEEITTEASKAYPDLKKGDVVGIYSCNSCQREDCKMCSSGHMCICPNVKKYGLGIDGGFADYLVAEARSLVTVPDSIKDRPDLVANATDAIMTPYRSMVRSGVRERAKNTSFALNLCVIGLGGLGSNLIQILRHVAPQSRIVGVDNKPGAVKAADGLGALNEAYLTSEAGAKLKPEFDIVYDCCGIPDTFRLAQDILGLAGTIMLIGIHENEVPHYTRANCIKEAIVMQTYGGNIEELRDCINLVAEGVVRPVIESRSLEEANAVLEDFVSNKLIGRVVLTP